MIDIRDVSYSYRKKRPVFSGLNLELQSGNIYGLLGKNGAGKSTLLKIMSGLLFPQNGELEVVGFRPKDRSPHFLEEIYMVNEEFYLPPYCIDRFIDLYSPFYSRFDHDALKNHLNEFQLDYNQKLSDLSYGQKKKFLLSFGLATDCRLLILDEPTNGLDIPSKSKFRKVVASAIHDERTFVISTHQVRDMENLIDPIIILDEGEIVFYQNNEAVAKNITISREKDLPDDDLLIYSEPHLGGYTVVKKNQGREESPVNLEMLFNAVVSSKEKIFEIFKKD